MQNKIWPTIGVIFIISLVSIYLVWSDGRRIGGAITKLTERLDQEVQRLNRRTSTNVYAGEPVGYVIKFENGAKFYVAGDTAPSADMKLVIGDYYQPDVAILPIGGYFTMGPKEAAFSTSLVRPKKYIAPYHYASYPMLVPDATEFKQALGDYGLADKLLTFEVGKEKEVMGVKVIWLGHASLFLISPEGKRILIDPASKLDTFPQDYKDFTKFENVDLVLLTHGHPDHVVTSDLDRLNRMYGSIVMAPHELGIWLQENVAIPETIVSVFNKGWKMSKEAFARLGLPSEKIGAIEIDVVSASHSSSAAPQP